MACNSIETCDGCKKLTSKHLGDCTIEYVCKDYPGLCIGDRGLNSNPKYDEPIRCKKYDPR